MRKTHSVANFPMNMIVFFSSSAQNREKKNFHKHTNSHLHRDESGCKWAKRCVLESGPSALRWGTNRLLPQEYQNMSSMSVTSVQVRTMGRSKCRDRNTNKFGEICIWCCSPRPLEKQSRRISKHLDSIQSIPTVALAFNLSLLQTPVANISF